MKVITFCVLTVAFGAVVFSLMSKDLAINKEIHALKLQQAISDQKYELLLQGASNTHYQFQAILDDEKLIVQLLTAMTNKLTQ